ncbi:uncharacterized protein A1O9_03686 [Exophiala aquamarina CBS 119918]|uniref:SET domain-containing protein n=1 Tax=Exophiala aquamarina CBS 119918 TaxID=1182545 RepID=A0A072PHR9_9EURO|nr:uncharacterized protein A1O9_03686 [Exophiala aquamarina CBS 119918]KEF58843.1 hypothetical protein A1O9_03686 [Exophiala aquamarina CBS 119918]
MDRPWQDKAYHPTARPLVPFTPPSPEDHGLLQRQLQVLSTSIRREPYNFHRWLGRADILLKLGYPELALGDCYRAQILLSRRHPDNHVRNEGEWQGQLRSGIPSARDTQLQAQAHSSQKPDEQSDYEGPSVTLTEDDTPECTLLEHFHRAFLQSNSLAHALATCLRGMSRFPHHAYFQDTMPMTEWLCDRTRAQAVAEPQRSRAEQHETQWGGSVLMRAYPWMSEGVLWRDDDVVDVVRGQVERASGGRCTVRRRSRAEADEDEDEDGLGMFAVREIEVGSTILIDPSPVGTAKVWEGRCECCYTPLPDRPARVNCCNTPFCSAKCADLAMATCHPAHCNRPNPVSPTQDASSLLSADSLGRLQVLRRMLAVIIHSGAADPLLAPTIRHLKPQYRLSRPMYFNYHTNIIIPFQILESLGIDIFSDTRFDTWVLHTIVLRLNNNQHGGDFGTEDKTMALSPLYSLFNHSCAPNVIYRNVRGGTTVEMVAERNVGFGQELCISYLSDVGERPRAERQALMEAWIGGECQCDRCTGGTKGWMSSIVLPGPQTP